MEGTPMSPRIKSAGLAAIAGALALTATIVVGIDGKPRGNRLRRPDHPHPGQCGALRPQPQCNVTREGNFVRRIRERQAGHDRRSLSAASSFSEARRQKSFTGGRFRALSAYRARGCWGFRKYYWSVANCSRTQNSPTVALFHQADHPVGDCEPAVSLRDQQAEWARGDQQ